MGEFTYFNCQECPYGTTSPKHAHEHYWVTGHSYVIEEE